MLEANKQEIVTFSRKFEKCVEDVGNNQLAIDGSCLRSLVAQNRDAAWGFVVTYCSMAKDQPPYVMTAYIVAVAYEVVFSDDTLEKVVIERAKELKATKYLFDIKTLL